MPRQKWSLILFIFSLILGFSTSSSSYANVTEEFCLKYYNDFKEIKKYQPFGHLPLPDDQEKNKSIIDQLNVLEKENCKDVLIAKHRRENSCFEPEEFRQIEQMNQDIKKLRDLVTGPSSSTSQQSPQGQPDITSQSLKSPTPARASSPSSSTDILSVPLKNPQKDDKQANNSNSNSDEDNDLLPSPPIITPPPVPPRSSDDNFDENADDRDGRGQRRIGIINTDASSDGKITYEGDRPLKTSKPTPEPKRRNPPASIVPMGRPPSQQMIHFGPPPVIQSGGVH